DQNLHDNTHSKERRGRSAPLNMVLTESNATKSVGKLLPELAGKLTGNSIRVPVPNVSMAILHLTLEGEVTREEVNEYLRDVALNSSMQRQIDYTISSEVVSTDFIGNRHAGIVDSHATIVDGKHVVLYVWYDNEFGYSCQVVRVGQKMAGIKYPIVPMQSRSDASVAAEEAPKVKLA
ncbi:MAG: glyceraldehyde-3-phosphate dehydrogenase, partial [Pseudomonadales bacterium]|nr:glyceraldehyde-3-phosphate dehydrogenase [Pseudomonadales bacterium]